MDDIHGLLSRQNENLRRLEVALSDAMNRIEVIEKLYICDKEKALRFEEQSYIQVNSIPEELNRPIDRIKDCYDFIEIGELTNTSQSLALNGTKEIKNNDSHTSKRIKNNILIVEDPNSFKGFEQKSKLGIESELMKINNSLYDFKNEKLLNTSKRELFNLNSTSTTPETPLSTEMTGFRGDSTHLKEFSTSEKNILIHINEQSTKQNVSDNLNNIKEKIYSNEVVSKSNDFPECPNEYRNQSFQENVSNEGDDINKQYFIFDEDENSNTINDSLDLENEENEFYYLKHKIERIPLSRKEQKGLNNLQIKNESEDTSSIGYVCSTGPKSFNMRPTIREIIYHIPCEKIIGYVQIPYNTLLYKANSLDGESKTYLEIQTRNFFFKKDKNFPRLKLINKYRDTHKQTCHSRLSNQSFNHFSCPLIYILPRKFPIYIYSECFRSQPPFMARK